MNETLNGYLIRSGDVYDGAGGPARRADVRTAGGTIVEIGPNLASKPDETVLDAAGLLVMPGLTDLHAHVFSGVGRWSLDPAEAGLATGVTTILDTGTAGALTYAAFARHVIARADEDVFALLNVSLLGCLQGYPDTPPANIGELADARLAHAPSAVACIEANRGRIVGVKVRLTASLADHRPENEWAGLRAAREAADATGLPLMVHHANSNVPLPDLLAHLRAGDIYTHLYHPHGDSGFDANGAPSSEMRAARTRGVVFDVGHGKGAFSWRVAEAACQNHGFWPDTISTDLHQFNVKGPVYDLPTTMSKFLHLGMPLESVICAATSAPSDAMRRGENFGRLLPGRPADITLLKIEPGAWPLEDVLGQVCVADARLVPVHVFKRGKRRNCRPANLPDHA